jgi:hypothetical protein
LGDDTFRRIGKHEGIERCKRKGMIETGRMEADRGFR